MNSEYRCVWTLFADIGLLIEMIEAAINVEVHSEPGSILEEGIDTTKSVKALA